MTSGGKSWSDMGEAARREYWASLALRHCRGVGALSAARLLKTFGSAYGAVRAREHWLAAGLHQGQAATLASGSWRVTAREEWNRARGLPVSIVLWHDPEYPEILRQLPDAPVLLYCRGDLSLLRSPAFAIVGSRQATGHGRAVAGHMARCLSACGLVIVSGMAMGIDRMAHEAALKQVGRSIGVLGTGIDVPYPSANMPIFDAMERQGLLISEFAPGARPLPEHFPVRNRIISGLALGVLVVEAASRSGSLITARLALEQNREVYAVPGPALDAHCLGCQDLVRQGARAVFNAEDVLRDLAEQLRPYGITEASMPEGESQLPRQENQDDRPPDAARPARTGKQPWRKAGARARADKPLSGDAPQARAVEETAAAVLTGEELAAARGLGPADRKDALLAHLRAHGPAQTDVLVSAMGLSAAEVKTMLIGLEMLGQVKRLPGARYEVTA